MQNAVICRARINIFIIDSIMRNKLMIVVFFFSKDNTQKCSLSKSKAGYPYAFFYRSSLVLKSGYPPFFKNGQQGANGRLCCSLTSLNFYS